jgi:hypothetical protein
MKMVVKASVRMERARAHKELDALMWREVRQLVGEE